VSRSVDRWPSTGLFERGDARGEAASAEEKLPGRHETLFDVKTPRGLIDALYS